MSGLMQSGILSAFALGAVALPGSYPHYLSMVQALGIGPVLIFSAKFVLAFPILFHFWNGFRHLAWDMGHGFKIAELYKVQTILLQYSHSLPSFLNIWNLIELFSVWLLRGGLVGPLLLGSLCAIDNFFYSLKSTTIQTIN